MKKWYRGFDFGMEGDCLVITSDSGPNVAWALRYGSKCSFRFETVIKDGENYYQVAQGVIDAHWTEKGC
jgi:hypothetical protein